LFSDTSNLHANNTEEEFTYTHTQLNITAIMETRYAHLNILLVIAG